MSIKLFNFQGGELILPDKELVLVSREDGGNLVVNPARKVWERGELNSTELTLWSFLVAAAGKAMLDVLPQLENGCINYWEAGNWALNYKAEPKNVKKIGKLHRTVHLHLLGRNPESVNPSMQWGEAPDFPNFLDRHEWTKDHKRLTAEECNAIVERTVNILQIHYEIQDDQLNQWRLCEVCNYPVAAEIEKSNVRCEECTVLE